MALAFLSQRIASQKGIKFKAFIVDHKVRAESTTEAKEVARYVSQGLRKYLHF